MKPILLLAICALVFFSLRVESAELSSPGPIELTGTKGKFDFIKVDATNKRLLACHAGNGSLDVIELTTSKLMKSVPTGAAQGVAVDEKGQRYFVSTSKPPKLVIVDAAKLEVTGEVPLPEAADLVAWQEKTGRVFVCSDVKPEIWVIDPAAGKIVSTFTLSGEGMEDLGFNGDETALFQCLKETGVLAKLDPDSGKTVAQWTTKPAGKPHGLAMIPGTDNVAVAGGNGKLALMSLTSGQVLAFADIAPGVDEIAYDPGTQRVYCASGGKGTISVVQVGTNNLMPQPSLSSQQGAHSIAVDPATHTVWIAFAGKDGKAYIQAFPQTTK